MSSMKNKRTNASFYGIAVLSCVLDVFTNGCVIVFACLVITTSAVHDYSIYNIGKTHCPCTRFCSDGNENINAKNTNHFMKRRSFAGGGLDVCLNTEYYQPSAEGKFF